MESDYKFRYVNDYITNLLDGNMTLQYEDVDLKSVKKPIEYLDKIEKWLNLEIELEMRIQMNLPNLQVNCLPIS